MSIRERRATIREFYGAYSSVFRVFPLDKMICTSYFQTLAGVIFPSLLQLHRGITDVEERKQKEVFAKKFRRKDETDKGKLSMADLEREEECGICMEISSKIVLPNCSHSLCMRCYRNWYATFHQPSP